MRYEDLPAKARAQVDAQVGKRRKARTTRHEVTIAESPGLPLSCTRCDFVALPATETRLAAHQAATGHGRFEYRPRRDEEPATGSAFPKPHPAPGPP